MPFVQRPGAGWRKVSSNNRDPVLNPKDPSDSNSRELGHEHTGKRVLITGSASGHGAATMAALLEKGCKVVGIDKVASARFEAETIGSEVSSARACR
jgi:hypothetical protein